MKKYKNYIILTVIIILIYVFSLVLNGIRPFGNSIFLYTDAFYQGEPFLVLLRDWILNFNFSEYSFSIAGGIPFFRTLFTYLSSPFNILAIFFNRNNMDIGYTIILILKVIFSSFSMYFYLTHKFNKDDLRFVIAALLYALSGYTQAFSCFLNWLDVLIFLPIIIYGVECIVNKYKFNIYIISFGLLIIINYYMAYMAGLFIGIYFIIYLMYKGKFDSITNINNMSKAFLIFCFSSILALGIGAFSLLPIYKEISYMQSGLGGFLGYNAYPTRIFDLILNNFSLVLKSYVFYNGCFRAPNITLSSLFIILFILFVFNKKIKLKTKIIYLLLFSFIILIFFNTILDFAFNAFHTPNGAPYRYSFIYVFVGTVIMAYSLNKLDYINKRGLIIIGVLLISFLLIVLLYKLAENVNVIFIIYNSILITLLIGALLLYFKNKKWGLILLLIITSIDLGCLTYYNLNDSKFEYISYLIDDKVNNLSTESGERVSFENFNNNVTVNYNNLYSLNGYSSALNHKYFETAHKLGVYSSTNNINYKLNNSFINMIYNIKYFNGDTYNYNNKYNLDNDVYSFNYTFGLMTGVKDGLNLDNLYEYNIINYEDSYMESEAFNNHNNLFKDLTKLDKDLYYEINYIDKEIVYEDDDFKLVKYTYPELNDSQEYYFYTDSYNIDFIINDTTLFYNDNKYNYIDYKLEYDKRISIYDHSMVYVNDNVIYVGYNDYNRDEVKLYQMSNDVFYEGYNILYNNKINITEFKEDYIVGNCNYESDMSVFSSIPYDEGWNVYVDGKKVDTYAYLDTFLCFDVDKGEHEIVLKYKTPYLRLGLFISICSFIIVIIINIFIRKKKLINN